MAAHNQRNAHPSHPLLRLSRQSASRDKSSPAVATCSACRLPSRRLSRSKRTIATATRTLRATPCGNARPVTKGRRLSSLRRHHRATAIPGYVVKVVLGFLRHLSPGPFGRKPSRVPRRCALSPPGRLLAGRGAGPHLAGADISVSLQPIRPAIAASGLRLRPTRCLSAGAASIEYP